MDTIKKEGLFNRARQLTELVLNLLKERRQTIDQMNRLKNMTQTKSRTAFKVNPFKEELTEIVPVNFLQHLEDYEQDLYQVFLIPFHFPHPKVEVV